jgi:hypothetical protein
VRLGQRLLFLDALHPRPAGVNLIARRAAAAIRRVLGARADPPADRAGRAPQGDRSRSPA